MGLLITALRICRGRDVLFPGQLRQLEIVFEDLAQHFVLRPVERRLLGIGAARLAGNGRPGKVDPRLFAPRYDYDNAALELAYVLAIQGHRDQTYKAIGLARLSDSPGVHAWVEAALGERERAMELLHESGPWMQRPHEATHPMFGWFWPLRDYPPFLELIGATE